MIRIFLRYINLKILFSFFVVATCVILTLIATWSRTYSKGPLYVTKSPAARIKTIYLQDFPSFYELKMGGVQFEWCPTPLCSFTQSLPTADAVMFYTHNSPLIKPPPKPPHQTWIYFAVESPENANNNVFANKEWDNLINWTMTYRKDSDIRFGYGEIFQKLQPVAKQDYSSITKSKTKLVAWLVSNCNTNSQRGEFVKLLQKYISVDIYGRCGTLICERNAHSDCIQMLNTDYKFYLSFENSLCQDYVTEKLYNILKHNIIPIVRGGANYSDILPFKSVIDTSLFSSVKDLAEYLKYLDSNDEEYAKYFDWKDSHYVEEPQRFPLCEICRRLHSPQLKAKVYGSVHQWWRTGACHEPTDLV